MAEAWRVKWAVVVALLMGSLFLWREGAADSTIQNLSKATMSVNSHILDTGDTVTIAISSRDSVTSIDLAYTKNITGVSIKNNKEYFVVENRAGTEALQEGQLVATLDLVEAKIIESAF
ncbi:uncharacterized protein [Physcomitrium patens]|uniref:Uncharacterized protein n=1 Tax=Physcomitrium patens TaxID=3218 RepID=A9SX76_PHYPA|nr:uncharacterized protein LOC112286668 [Physcomitrium patens]PNR48723.1 hypothetical protein PHYPA_013200 [Physcomitrium patens]|eukprot:XP_024384548.1 uncharacterized protein LOC112286668 [Physcomitrella patens]